MVRWIGWLALPLPVLVFLGASSPAVAQRTPRFLFPAVAVIGAVLIVTVLVRSLARLVRLHRREGRVRFLPVAVNVVAVLLFVVLPLTRLPGAIAPARPGAPRILTVFGDWQGAEGYPRTSARRGLDVAGRVGDDVLAAAGGRVTVARDNRDLCGLIVVIDHEPHGYPTVYCHFSAIAVQVGDRVERGQRIGTVGTSGQRAWPGFEHVHLELQRGRDVDAIEDPLPWIVGCFDRTTPEAADRLVLTYPVRC